MNKKNILTIALMLVCLVSSAQTVKLSKDYKVEVSQPYPVTDGSVKEYIPINENLLLMLKVRGEVVSLQRFNPQTMKELSSKKYEDFPKYMKFTDVLKMGDKVYYFFESYDKKTKKFSVHSREIDAAKGTFMPEKKLITTSRPVRASKPSADLTKSKMPTLGVKYGPKFNVEKSFDGSKVLIHFNLEPLTKKDSENRDEFGLYVFDTKMTKVWGKEVTMPKTEAEINNLSFALGNNGNVKLFIANNTSKRYELYAYDTSGKMEEIDLGISIDKTARDFKLKEDANGNFTCLAFYANGFEFKFWTSSIAFNVNGLLYFELDNNDNVSNIKTFDFSKEFIMQNLSDRQKKKVLKQEEKGKAGILDLVMKDVFFEEDGSITVAAETQFVEIVYSGRSYKTYYNFDNMVIMKLNDDRELVWMKKLPKMQEGLNGVGQMSFTYMLGEEFDYVAYIDNPKNIKLNPKGGVPAAHMDGKGGYLTTYKIDKRTGELEKHTILALEKLPKGYKAYQFKTTRIVSMGKGVHLMEVYVKDKKDVMVKLSEAE
jgi:hypothetical protein